MSLVKKRFVYILLCLIMVFVCPISQVYAQTTGKQVVQYKVEQDSIVIDNGGNNNGNNTNNSGGTGPIRTSDQIDLYNCLIMLSLSAFSVILLIKMKEKKDREIEIN